MPGKNFDLTNRDQIAGAVYFAVGRGTEGGNASYHLSITGVTNASKATDPGWGDIKKVIARSGYTLGSIQVDFGQRGTWALGAISQRQLQPGEKTYVQAVVDEAVSYARSNGLPFTNDHVQLRKDLLSRGPSLHFIDTDTRNAINQWASSKEGTQWIHQNIDLPQVRNATDLAIDIVKKHGKYIQEDRRFEVVCMLAKTANQLPGKLPMLEKALLDGGDYDHFMQSVKAINAKYRFYAAEHAGALASAYEENYRDPKFSRAMDRAHKKTMAPTYDPSLEDIDPDIQITLKAINRVAPPRSAGAVDLPRPGEHGAPSALSAQRPASGQEAHVAAMTVRPEHTKSPLDLLLERAHRAVLDGDDYALGSVVRDFRQSSHGREWEQQQHDYSQAQRLTQEAALAQQHPMEVAQPQSRGWSR